MSRRSVRTIAFQMTYQIDVGGNTLAMAEETTLQNALKDGKCKGDDCDYIHRVVSGIIQERKLLDDFIQRAAVNWELSRIHSVEKNILRLALYEMLYCDEIPMQVSIDEAIELAKEFAGAEAYAFVNGILDTARKEIEKNDSGH